MPIHLSFSVTAEVLHGFPTSLARVFMSTFDTFVKKVLASVWTQFVGREEIRYMIRSIYIDLSVWMKVEFNYQYKTAVKPKH